MIRAIVILVALLATSASYGQPDIPKTNVSDKPSASPGSSSSFTPGKYSGRVTERQGTRQSDFELDLSRNPGTITMYRADRACRTESISLISVKDDVVRLESKGNTAGCDNRVFDLKVTGNELTGTMTIYNRVFDVKAKK